MKGSSRLYLCIHSRCNRKTDDIDASPWWHRMATYRMLLKNHSSWYKGNSEYMDDSPWGHRIVIYRTLHRGNSTGHESKTVQEPFEQQPIQGWERLCWWTRKRAQHITDKHSTMLLLQLPTEDWLETVEGLLYGNAYTYYLHFVTLLAARAMMQFQLSEWPYRICRLYRYYWGQNANGYTKLVGVPYSKCEGL